MIDFYKKIYNNGANNGDLKVICAGRIFNVHSDIIAMRCPYFMCLYNFKQNQSDLTENLDIIRKKSAEVIDIPPSILNDIFIYIYTGELVDGIDKDISLEDKFDLFLDIYKFADMIRLEDLTTLIENDIISNISGIDILLYMPRVDNLPDRLGDLIINDFLKKYDNFSDEITENLTTETLRRIYMQIINNKNILTTMNIYTNIVNNLVPIITKIIDEYRLNVKNKRKIKKEFIIIIEKLSEMMSDFKNNMFHIIILIEYLDILVLKNTNSTFDNVTQELLIMLCKEKNKLFPELVNSKREIFGSYFIQ